VLHQVYAADLAANPGHSPPLSGERTCRSCCGTLADEQTSASPNKKEQITIAMMALVALRLQSTPV
jgi:hypothetical protein